MGRARRTVGATSVLLWLPSTLGAQAVSWSGGATVVGQVVNDPRIRDEIVASLDLFVDVRFGSAFVVAYVEGNTTPFAGGVSQLVGEANTDAGTAVDARRQGRVQLSELRLVWPVAADLRAHAGLMDATGFLDVSRIANDENLFFLAVPFVNNPTIGFPDYALGGAIEGALPAGAPLRVGLTLLSSHGLADNPEVSYGQLLDVGEEGKGVFLGAVVRWVTPGYRASLGAWTSDARHAKVDATGGAGARRGAFSVLGWSRGEHALSARFGVADESVSLARGFASLTYLFASGPAVFGLALGRSFASEAAPNLDHMTHGEAFFRRRLLGEVFVTASLQHIVNSGFDGSDASVAPRLWLGGIRLSARF